ncbi:MAG: prepilin-type N-terminal cleavage/methylation domain-containing protein [Mariprofundaceae bacterium]|nr:prepilin-type N-terminal cleavage/methylation domain-containing protein [Mariprofundaceae bacterium]
MLKQGFTLVEILIALVIVSVGMLALGSFYTAMISQEGIAQERITAVHMAEQLIEDWQANNVIPTPNCLVAGAPPVLVLATATSNCVPTKGTPIAYTILLNERPALAPLPVTHPNNPSLNVINALGVDMYSMLTLSDVNKNVIANSPQVKVRSVQVSWTHEKRRTVQLTHITRYVP